MGAGKFDALLATGDAPLVGIGDAAIGFAITPWPAPDGAEGLPRE